MTKKILVTRLYPDAGIQLLEKQGFQLTRWEKDRPMTPGELKDVVKSHDALLCTLTDAIDADFLSDSRHLDIVSQYAVGFDNIDVNAATALGIPVGHTPDVLTEATADIAFGLMIAVARKMIFMHKTIAKGEWGFFNPTGHLGLELKGKTLGIVGLGRIGMSVAKRCKAAYDMDILYYNRSANVQAEKTLGAKRVSFEALLANSDIVSAHCALTDQTAGLFNREAFCQMKSSAIFINTARGGIHNEDDLVAALEENRIWGAGLDVTNPEPMRPDHPLLDMENVCILPHIGSATVEARNAMSVLAANNLIEFYNTGNVPHCVNPEVFKKVD